VGRAEPLAPDVDEESLNMTARLEYSSGYKGTLIVWDDSDNTVVSPVVSIDDAVDGLE